MKKGLFTTSAIVAVAFAGTAMAKDVSLGLGGGITTGVGVGQYDNGTAPNLAKDFITIFDGEIHFSGKGTLDNGIQISTRVELEAVSESDQIDEQWVQVKSQFGTIMIGGNDDAGYNVGGVGITSVAIGMAPWDGSYVFVPAGVGTIGGNDSLGVHYYTPNIAGFEAGISYQNTIGGSPDANATRNNNEAGATTNDFDRVSFGAAYSNSFGDFDFAIGGAYIMDDFRAANSDDTQWGLGASVGFSGFKVEGRYENFDNDGGSAGDQDRYGAGVTYSTGPWAFAIAGVVEETEAGAADVEEVLVAAGAKYELGDGVNVGAGITYGETETAGAGGDFDGFGGALLLGVSF